MSSLDMSTLANESPFHPLRLLVTGAVLALALSVATGVSAQTPPANKPVTAPKQVGAWTVIVQTPRTLASEAGGSNLLWLARSQAR